MKITLNSMFFSPAQHLYVTPKAFIIKKKIEKSHQENYFSMFHVPRPPSHIYSVTEKRIKWNINKKMFGNFFFVI